MRDFEIDHIRADDPVDGFQSREPRIAEFFADQARSHETNGFGRTYVARCTTDDTDLPRVLGFYTVAMARVQLNELPASLQDGLPAFPLPVALLGQLARDRRTPAEWKLGEILLQDALERVLRTSEDIGCAGIILDALNEGLVEYYARFSFVPLPRTRFPRKMFLPMHDIRAAVES